MEFFEIQQVAGFSCCKPLEPFGRSICGGKHGFVIVLTIKITGLLLDLLTIIQEPNSFIIAYILYQRASALLTIIFCCSASKFKTKKELENESDIYGYNYNHDETTKTTSHVHIPQNSQNNSKPPDTDLSLDSATNVHSDATKHKTEQSIDDKELIAKNTYFGAQWNGLDAISKLYFQRIIKEKIKADRFDKIMYGNNDDCDHDQDQHTYDSAGSNATITTNSTCRGCGIGNTLFGVFYFFCFYFDVVLWYISATASVNSAVQNNFSFGNMILVWWVLGNNIIFHLEHVYLLFVLPSHTVCKNICCKGIGYFLLIVFALGDGFVFCSIVIFTLAAL